MADVERLSQLAADLSIPRIRRHIFLCSDQTKPKCCAKEAGLEAWEYLKRRIAELGLFDRVYRTRPTASASASRGRSRWSTQKASGITRHRPRSWSESSRSI